MRMLYAWDRFSLVSTNARIEPYEQCLDTIGVCMYYYLAVLSAISDVFSEI